MQRHCAPVSFRSLDRSGDPLECANDRQRERLQFLDGLVNRQAGQTRVVGLDEQIALLWGTSRRRLKANQARNKPGG